MEKYAINITLAGRSYRLKVSATEEEYVRAAANVINEKVNEFSGNYAFKDKQDLLAMAAITFATEFTKHRKLTENSGVMIEDKLHEINDILSK
jgi:cell division protein ZapA